MEKLAVLAVSLAFFLSFFIENAISYSPPPNGTFEYVFTWSTEIVGGCQKPLNSTVSFNCYPNTPCTCSGVGASCTNYTTNINDVYCLGTDSQYHSAYWAKWWEFIPQVYNMTVTPPSGYTPKWEKVDIRLYNASYSSQCQSEDSYNTCFDCYSDAYGAYIYGFGYDYCAHNHNYTIMPSDTAYYLVGNRTDWWDACGQLCSVGYDPLAGYDLRNVFIPPTANQNSVTITVPGYAEFWACLYFNNGTIAPDAYGFLRRCGLYMPSETFGGGYEPSIEWGGVPNGSYYFKVAVPASQVYQSQVFTLPPSHSEVITVQPSAFTVHLYADRTYVSALGQPVVFTFVMGTGVPPYYGTLVISGTNGYHSLSFPNTNLTATQQSLTLYSGLGAYDLGYGANYIYVTVNDSTGVGYATNQEILVVTVQQPQDVVPTGLVTNATDPIPIINATEWRNAGFAWVLPFLTPMFLYTFFYSLFAALSGILTKNMAVPVGIFLVFLTLGTLFGFYPTWIGIVLITITGFIFAYLIRGVISGG
jgi:hypothetical protein